MCVSTHLRSDLNFRNELEKIYCIEFNAFPQKQNFEKFLL